MRSVKEKITAGVVALLAVIMMSGTATAQETLGNEEKLSLIETLTKDWNNDWQTASISGKFKMAGLPLSPTLKIYMERDSSIFISLRAPLMGEVGRAEIDADSILVVNKMKKTYVKESVEKALDYYPGTLSDLQDILLGRAVIPGYGLLNPDLSEVVEVYPEITGQYSLIPGEKAELEAFDYGYLIDTDVRPAALVVMPADKTDVSVTIAYEYQGSGYDLAVTYKSSEKIYAATLQLDEPSWEGNPIEPITINSKYQRMTFSEFMKSF